MNMGTLSLRAFSELFPDEVSARAWFERARWPDGPVCPSSASASRMAARSGLLASTMSA